AGVLRQTKVYSACVAGGRCSIACHIVNLYRSVSSRLVMTGCIGDPVSAGVPDDTAGGFFGRRWYLPTRAAPVRLGHGAAPCGAEQGAPPPRSIRREFRSDR